MGNSNVDYESISEQIKKKMAFYGSLMIEREDNLFMLMGGTFNRTFIEKQIYI